MQGIDYLVCILNTATCSSQVKDFLVYVLASFLLSWSEQLRTLEFQELIMFLQVHGCSADLGHLWRTWVIMTALSHCCSLSNWPPLPRSGHPHRVGVRRTWSWCCRGPTCGVHHSKAQPRTSATPEHVE